jgi:hypothetical protein
MTVVRELGGPRLASLGVSSGGHSPRYFHAVFMAIFELIFRDQMRIKDYSAAAARLDGLAKSTLSVPAGGGDWRRDSKRQSIDAVKGVLRGAFEETGDGEDFGRYAWASQLETILSNSLVEQQLFECKQGLLSLNHDRAFDEDSFTRILRTLTAMANVGPGAIGYVAIGIADDAQDAQRVKSLDSVDVLNYRQFQIVGIEREAARRGQSLNDYWAWLVQRIRGSKLDQRLGNYVATTSRLVNYRNHAVALLKTQGQDSPCFFDNVLIERSGSETLTVGQSDYMRIYRHFVKSDGKR